MTLNRHHWRRLIAATGFAGVATVAAAPSAHAMPDSLIIVVDDVPDRVSSSGLITYTIEATNGEPTANTNSLIAVSWEPATFVSFSAPPGWTVNEPPTVTPNALTTFTDSWPADSTVTFTLVLDPTSPGRFDLTASIFSDIPDQTLNTDSERTIVTGAP